MSADLVPNRGDKAGVGEALENLFENVTSGIIQHVNIVDEKGNATGKRKARFILQSSGYHDLKAHLTAGMVFPQSKYNFERLHSKKRLKKLIELDPKIYQQTEDAMISIYQHCNTFNSKVLPKLGAITYQTMEYSQYTILQLIGFGEGSFRSQLDILTDDKYGKEGSENSDEFREASQQARMILVDLWKNSLKNVDRIRELIKEISSFSVEVKVDRELVDAVTLKFNGNGTTENLGHSRKLSPELAQLRKEIETAAKAARSAHDDFESHSSTARWTAAYTWIPFAGWVAGGTAATLYNNKAKEAWTEYNRQLDVEAGKNNEVESLENIISDVNLMSNQNTILSQKVDKVMQALNEMQRLFEHMAEKLGFAANLIGAADGSVRKSLWSRKMNLRSCIDGAAKSWQDAAEACSEFAEATDDISVEGITSDVTPPKIG